MISNENLKIFLDDDNDLDGWFYPGDMVSIAIIDTIQTNQRLEGSICEVGVFKGKSLSFFSHLIKENEKLLGYDLFLENHYECTELALKNYGKNIDCELIKANTSDLKPDDIKHNLRGKNIRILHIDAGHEYHEVLQTLLLFAPFVEDNGVIIMDDFQDREFHGVAAAVLDFCEIDRPRRFVPFFSGQNKIYLSVRHMAGFLQTKMLANSNINVNCRLTIVRDFSILKGFSRNRQPHEDVLKRIKDFESTNARIYQNSSQSLINNSTKYSQLNYGFSLG
tara:strand:- start:42 stop:878 length:837 start_codon:yes stop_codon:yes gene_type:complete